MVTEFITVENIHSRETTDLEFILFSFSRMVLRTMSQKGEPAI